ncbi:MAG TPA: hypothetical protein VIL79_11645 [Thermoleophilia bacterium]
MLVATFGTTTAWVGKTVTWDGDQFVLEGYGRVPAAALIDYDQQGHLRWASAELRSWAWSYAHWEAGRAAAAQAAAQSYTAARPQMAAQPWSLAQPGASGPAAGAKEPFPAWAIVLIVAVVVLLVGGLFAAIMIPAVLFNDQRAKAHESAVKEGVHSLQVGIQSWAVDHQDVYPSALEMSPTMMSGYVEWWPTNPYSGAPMTQGTRPGDYFYQVTPDGTSFLLIGYGEDGNIVIQVGSAGSTI